MYILHTHMKAVILTAFIKYNTMPLMQKINLQHLQMVAWCLAALSTQFTALVTGRIIMGSDQQPETKQRN